MTLLVGRSLLVAFLLGLCLTLSGCESSATSDEATGQASAGGGPSPGEIAAAPSTVSQVTPIATHGTRARDERDPRAVEKRREITFDYIKFEMEKNGPFAQTMLTPAIKNLDHKPVRIRGYILPSFQQSGITQFVLVRDNLECCFGPGAALYDCIVVDMRPGKSAEYTVRPVTVDGEFRIQELLDPEGKHLAIYHLDGDAVE